MSSTSDTSLEDRQVRAGGRHKEQDPHTRTAAAQGPVEFPSSPGGSSLFLLRVCADRFRRSTVAGSRRVGYLCSIDTLDRRLHYEAVITLCSARRRDSTARDLRSSTSPARARLSRADLEVLHDHRGGRRPAAARGSGSQRSGLAFLRLFRGRAEDTPMIFHSTLHAVGERARKLLPSLSSGTRSGPGSPFSATRKASLSNELPLERAAARSSATRLRCVRLAGLHCWCRAVLQPPMVRPAGCASSSASRPRACGARPQHHP